MRKRITILMVTAVIILSGCGQEKSQSADNAFSDKAANQEKKQEQTVVDDGKDHEQGLLSMKLKDSEKLTEQQKKVVEYFDDDYLALVDDSSYEFLMRYPDVVTDAQILMCGVVAQVMSYKEGMFELVVIITDQIGEITSEDSVVVIRGKEGNMRYMKGDQIEFRGTYKGTEEFEQDGVPVQFPVVEIASPTDVYINEGKPLETDKYDISFIKDVATCVFGDDIEIRMPAEDDCWGNFGEELVLDDFRAGIGLLCYNYYVCELEDQSNNKFSKYYFSAANGWIVDSNNFAGGTFDSRDFNFTKDFEHYIVISRNLTSESFTDEDVYRSYLVSVEYYDRSHNKIWERQFEEVEGDYCYDYTGTAMYLVINQDMYTIDINTGEDMMEPVHIGRKDVIRKLEDGIVAFDFSYESEDDEYMTDAIMKLDLDGNIIWKQNVKEVLFDDGFGGFQVIGKNILVDLWIYDSERDCTFERFMLIDSESGEVLREVEPLN